MKSLKVQQSGRRKSKLQRQKRNVLFERRYKRKLGRALSRKSVSRRWGLIKLYSAKTRKIKK